MKFLKKYYLLFIIVLGLIVGIVSFFVVSNKTTKIVINSYDNVSNLYLGDEKIKNFTEDITSISFEIDNIDSFFEDLTNNDYYVKSITTDNDTYYLFNKDGYNYVCFNKNDRVVIKNLVVQIIGNYVIPFINFNNYEFDNSSYTWNDINKFYFDQYTNNEYNSYEDLKTFYQQINSNFVQFDDVNKKINLKLYQNIGYCEGDRLSSNFNCTITCYEDHITFYCE